MLQKQGCLRRGAVSDKGISHKFRTDPGPVPTVVLKKIHHFGCPVELAHDEPERLLSTDVPVEIYDFFVKQLPKQLQGSHAYSLHRQNLTARFLRRCLVGHLFEN